MASRARRGVGEKVPQGRRIEQFSSATVRPAATVTGDSGVISSSQINTPRVPTQELRELVERSPEASNAIDWLTHGASRAALFPCQLTEEGLPGVRTKDADVIAATQPLTGPMYASDFLEQGSWHMLVPGEFYLYGYENERAFRQTERQRWAVVDADNVFEQGANSYQVRYERDGREREDTITVVDRPDGSKGLSAPLIRIWNPDKKEPWRATSPILANLQVLRALDKMTRLVPALADQRISGPRILAVSNRLDLPEPMPGRRFSKNKIVDRLARAVDAAKRNPSSIENLLPIILSGDLTEEVFKKLEWGVEFPELTVDIMELLLKRLATGLPVPSEVTLGESDTSHWGQWFNEESTVKLSIEPLVTKIASALSRQWLPVVLPFGRDINEWVIGHDVRSVMLRPDRSAIAVQLFELGELNGQALRRETGFDEKDAPTPAEIARREQREQPPAAPGPDPGQGDRRPQQQIDLDPEAGRAARALPAGAPGGSASGGGVDRGLQAAAMVTVTAALARVGSYLKGNREFRGMVNGLPTCDIYTRAPVSLRAEVNDERIWPDGVLEVFLSSAKTAGCDPECAEALMRRHLQLCVSKARPEPIEFLIDGLNQCARTPVKVG